MDMTIEPASEADLASILALVQTCRLPIAGLEQYLGTGLVARDQGEIVGCAELEMKTTAVIRRSSFVVR